MQIMMRLISCWMIPMKEQVMQQQIEDIRTQAMERQEKTQLNKRKSTVLRVRGRTEIQEWNGDEKNSFGRAASTGW